MKTLTYLKLAISSLVLVTTQAMTPVPTIDFSEWHCMVTTLWHEARGESVEGVRAVAKVILNRKESKLYPDTICGVVKQPKQFTGVAEAFKRPISLVDSKGYARVSRVAFEALYGVLELPRGMSEGALSYHKVGHKVYWSKNLVNRKVIGKHVFGVVKTRKNEKNT